MRQQILMLSLLCGLSACGQEVQQARSAASPGATTSALTPGFAGAWVGVWDGWSVDPVQVTVSRVTADGEVFGSYQYGQNRARPFRQRLDGNAFGFPIGESSFTFTLQPDGKLRGIRQFPGGINTALLTRSDATPPPTRADALSGPTRMFCNTPGVPVPPGSVVYSGAWRSASGAPGTAAPTCMAVVALPDSAASALGEGYNGYYVWGDNPWGPRNGSSRARIERRADGSAFIRFNSGSTITLNAPASNGLSSGRFEHANNPQLNGVADQVRVERL